MTISDDLIKITEANKENKAKWKEIRKEKLIPHFPALRKENEDNFKRSPALALQTIAGMDGMLSLPVTCRIIIDLQQKNEAKVQEKILTLTGRQLATKEQENNDDGDKVGIDRIFFPILKVTAGDLFEEFIYKNKDIGDDLEKLKLEVVTKKVDSVIDVFCNRVILKPLEPQEREKLNELLRNEIFLACAYKAYLGADDKQTLYSFLGTKEAAFAATYTAVMLKKPFLALSHMAHRVTILPESKALWVEYVTWLEALYLRVCNLMEAKYGKKYLDEKGVIKKSEDGFYARVDKEDEKLHFYFNKLTKYDLSLLHFETVKILKPLLGMASVAAPPAPTEEIKKPIVFNVEEKSINGSRRVSFFLHESEELNDAVVTISQATNREIEVMRGDAIQNDKQLSLYLDSFLKTTQCTRLRARMAAGGDQRATAEAQLHELKIEKLEECYNQFSFTHAQRCALAFLIQNMENICENYKKSNRRTYYTGIVLQGACYEKQADEVLSSMKKTNDVKEHLSLLFNLRDILIVGKSRTLIHPINALLVQAFDCLHRVALPQIQEERKMSVRSG